MSLLTLLKGLPMTYNRDFAGGQGTPVRHRRHRARDHAAHGRDAVAHAGEQAGLRHGGRRPGAARHRPGGLSRAQRHAVPAGASCGGAGGGAGEKTFKPLNGLTLAQLQEIDKPLAGRAGRIQPETADGETEPDRRAARRKLRSNWRAGGHSFLKHERGAQQLVEANLALVYLTLRVLPPPCARNRPRLPARAHDYTIATQKSSRWRNGSTRCQKIPRADSRPEFAPLNFANSPSIKVRQPKKLCWKRPRPVSRCCKLCHPKI